MGQAAVKLLEANGQVVVSLEELAAVVGITPIETQAVIGEQLAQAR